MITTLMPEKRYYATTKMVMTEAAIDAGIGRDLYAALGENLGNGDWSVRLYYKPFMRWIWGGGLMMAFGGCCVCSTAGIGLIDQNNVRH
ncbi:cytochrome c-type biogenesis CcmF C-terminal domain-containing protein [Budvicia aquatica]|uniref:Cytochrome c-type biogenesis protein CcmF n=1 Tax=Budvicia aquatica TaxID=82979 RepID=A0A484ZNS1_9GAMM|nr:cytochrome c-type biogenesis CcmF C-terminal domain-containing protein [Budvicia aquatica]VFS49628.1 Cytochrome c-type biogenesis protein CcmF [Budvicia aquatica]